jgi:hypothetical protein
VSRPNSEIRERGIDALAAHNAAFRDQPEEFFHSRFCMPVLRAREAAANPDGVVIELAKLSKIKLAQCRKEKAKALGITVRELDQAISKSECHTATLGGRAVARRSVRR